MRLIDKCAFWKGAPRRLVVWRNRDRRVARLTDKENICLKRRKEKIDRRVDREVVVVVAHSKANPLVTDAYVRQHVRDVGRARKFKVRTATRAGRFEGVQIGGNGFHVEIEFEVGRLYL